MILSVNRVIAIVIRHLRPTLRDPMRYLDMFYWPLLDIFLWGFTTIWLKQNVTFGESAIVMLLTALVLWQIVFRASIEVTRNLLEELWHQNLINLFATPLTIAEWMIGILVVSFLHACWNMAFGSLVVYLLFKINVFALGPTLFLYASILLVFGWTTGFISSAIILFLGRRAEMIAWSFPWLFSVFSAVFYPLTVLPGWAQKIAWFLPSTYTFENVRYSLLNNSINLAFLTKSLLLAALYIGFAIILFRFAFDKAKTKGLSALE